MPLGTHATRQRSQSPNHWKHLQNLWVMGLGTTGDRVWDLGPSRNNGVTGAAGLWVPGGWQSGPESTSGASVNVGNPEWINSMLAFTALVYAKPLVAPASWANEDTLAADWAGSGNRHLLLRLDSSDSGRVEALLNVGGNTDTATVTIGEDIIDEFHGFGVTWDGETVTALYDDQRGSGVSKSGAVDTSADNPMRLGESDHNSADMFDGVIGLVGMWNYAMPRAMISEWMADPMKMLRPRSRRIAAPAAAVAGILTSEQGWSGGMNVPAMTGGIDG